MKFYKVIFLNLLLLIFARNILTFQKKSILYHNIIQNSSSFNKKDDVCSITVTWIKANFLEDEQIINYHIGHIGEDQNANAIREITKELNKNRVVCVSMKPDHHFCIYNNGKYIEIYQSSVKLYNLPMWMDYYFKNGIKLNLENYIKLLSNYFLGNSKDKAKEAVKKLFLFDLTQTIRDEKEDKENRKDKENIKDKEHKEVTNTISNTTTTNIKIGNTITNMDKPLNRESNRRINRLEKEPKMKAHENILIGLNDMPKEETNEIFIKPKVIKEKTKDKTKEKIKKNKRS